MKEKMESDYTNLIKKPLEAHKKKMAKLFSNRADYQAITSVNNMLKKNNK